MLVPTLILNQTYPHQPESKHGLPPQHTPQPFSRQATQGRSRRNPRLSSWRDVFGTMYATDPIPLLSASLRPITVAQFMDCVLITRRRYPYKGPAALYEVNVYQSARAILSEAEIGKQYRATIRLLLNTLENESPGLHRTEDSNCWNQFGAYTKVAYLWLALTACSRYSYKRLRGAFILSGVH